MANNIICADIGTNNMKMYANNNGKMLNEKNVIAVMKKKGILSFGDDAFDMVGKAPEDIQVTFPVREGVIADNDNMETLFKEFCLKVSEQKKLGPTDYYVAVPTQITELEKRAFYELVMNSKTNAKKVYVVDRPIADGIGAGIDVTNSKGVMIINIGADTTEVSVISLGGIVLSKCIKIAGNRLDENIINAVKKNYNLYIGAKTAEYLKIELGVAMPSEERFCPIYGRDVVSGLPLSVNVSSNVIYAAIEENIHTLVDSIKAILERTPPELAADIIDTGIYLSGGSSSISGLAELIAIETSLNVNRVVSPSESVLRGLVDIIKNPKKYDGIARIPREKVYY
ncbi:MAG: rod shape-determining protein [Lachnospiraceae bacterium]|nr:rod shape-determining protein [Lachnospiraceae bacterium]